MFAWPAGRWLVGLAGLVLVAVAVYQFVPDVKKKFLDGALAKFYNGVYGNVLLGVVAAGLMAFSVFALVETRYRRI